ncbi:hypothetical protein BD779DRAFT_317490 [Infundibulicybe gibba]|nr:hypothetical protein BD779DRAFT_317490 [Infundibulicybe gibba]
MINRPQTDDSNNGKRSRDSGWSRSVLKRPDISKLFLSLDMTQLSCLVLLFSALAMTVALPYPGCAESGCVEPCIGRDSLGQRMAHNPPADTADSRAENVAHQARFFPSYTGPTLFGTGPSNAVSQVGAVVGSTTGQAEAVAGNTVAKAGSVAGSTIQFVPLGTLLFGGSRQ